MDQEFNYKIVDPHEDHNKAVIEKSGTFAEQFTLEQVEKKQNEWSTEKRQLTAQLEVEQTAVDNITHHHPFVLEMSEEDQYTVYLYYETMMKVATLKKQIEMRVNALDMYQKEKEKIMDVLGFTKTQV